jgi:hypothetical protein
MHTNYDILTNQLLVEQARPRRRAALALFAVSDSCTEDLKMRACAGVQAAG